MQRKLTMSKKSNSQNGISTAGAIRLARKQKDSGVAPFHYATLVYPVAFTSSSLTGGDWYWQFRLNSLFDPDFTGTGSQPTTFDQWMALYDRYRVLATDVDLTVTSMDGYVVAVAAAPSVDAAPTFTYAGVMGLRDAKLGAAGTYISERRVKRTFAMKDVFGVDEEAMMSELNYSGTASSSAPAVAYLTVGLKCSSATGGLMIHGVLRFAVRFEDAHANNVSLTKTRVEPVPLPLVSRSVSYTVTADAAAAPSAPKKEWKPA